MANNPNGLVLGQVFGNSKGKIRPRVAPSSRNDREWLTTEAIFERAIKRVPISEEKLEQFRRQLIISQYNFAWQLEYTPFQIWEKYLDSDAKAFRDAVDDCTKEHAKIHNTAHILPTITWNNNPVRVHPELDSVTLAGEEQAKQGVDELTLEMAYVLKLKQLVTKGKSLRNQLREHVIEKWTRAALICLNALLLVYGMAMLYAAWFHINSSTTLGQELGVTRSLEYEFYVIGSGIVLGSLIISGGAARVMGDVLAETEQGDIIRAALDHNADTKIEDVDGLETVGQTIILGGIYVQICSLISLFLPAITIPQIMEYRGLPGNDLQLLLFFTTICGIPLLAWSIFLAVKIVSLYEVLQSIAEVFAALLTMTAGLSATAAVWIINRAFELRQAVAGVSLETSISAFFAAVWIMFVSMYALMAAWQESRSMLAVAAFALGVTVVPLCTAMSVYLAYNSVSSLIVSECDNVVESFDATFWDSIGCQKYVGYAQLVNDTSGRYYTTEGAGLQVRCIATDLIAGKQAARFAWEVNPVVTGAGKLVDHWGCLNSMCCETLADIVREVDAGIVGAMASVAILSIGLLSTLLYLRSHIPASVIIKVLKHNHASKISKLQISFALMAVTSGLVISFGLQRAQVMTNYADLLDIVNLNPVVDICGDDGSLCPVVEICADTDPSGCCRNGQRDGDEIGIDCGCVCASKGGTTCFAGQPCTMDCDCTSGCCLDGVCLQSCSNSDRAMQQCSNGILDGLETCVDGGGSGCRSVECITEQKCLIEGNSTDNCTLTCDENLDQDKLCSTCPDVQQPLVTTTICTQTGKLCAEGSTCNTSFDCEHGLLCSADGKCFDAKNGQTDGDETSIDCGGSSGNLCSDGKWCLIDSDCRSFSWCKLSEASSKTTSVLEVNDKQETINRYGVCQSYTDGLSNGGETGVDCGGTALFSCVDGQACTVAQDCTSQLCMNNICVSYVNSILDGDETGVDCGGSNSAKCPEGRPCRAGDDCIAGICEDPICRTAAQSGPMESRGLPCVFPFTFQGETYNACTLGTEESKPFAFDLFSTHADAFDESGQGDFWCATQHTYDAVSPIANLAWGFCNCADVEVSWRTYGSNDIAITNITDNSSTCAAIPRGQNCHFPFMYHSNDSSAAPIVFDSCPTIAQARPPGSIETELSDSTLWCPTNFITSAEDPNATHHFNMSDPSISRSDWGLCSCPSQSTLPANGVCGTLNFDVNTCQDGVLSVFESDIDCGGSCLFVDKLCVSGSICYDNKDCVSNECDSNSGTCASCTDVLLNGQETDVDCGGDNCAACQNGHTCGVGTDCSSGVCDRNTGTCVSCFNNLKDGGETDLDCGGAVCNIQGRACALGKTCSDSFDCQSGTCDALTKVCISRHDGVLNGRETDIDCGGGSASTSVGSSKCIEGKLCSTDDDCITTKCTGGGSGGQNRCEAVPITALPDHCSNGKPDIFEACVDGGGNCSPGGSAFLCPDGTNVGNTNGNDCISGYEVNGICVSCSNGKVDGWESDIDCGGSECPSCYDSQTCTQDGDCASRRCGDEIGNSTLGVCESCSDGIQNGFETDIDCGGTCEPCSFTGSMCSVNSDCSTNLCDAQILMCTSCFNGIKDADETDIDCGGSTCALRCPVDQACASHTDCMSVRCDFDTGLCGTFSSTAMTHCAAPNGLIDGTETDIDCGGDCALVGYLCASTQMCKDNSDCASYVCDKPTKRCVSCVDGIQNGDESDVDCGGSMCTRCVLKKGCVDSSDCLFGWCDPSLLTCEVMSLVSVIGSVDACETCSTDADCVSGVCQGCRCVPTQSIGMFVDAPAGQVDISVDDVSSGCYPIDLIAVTGLDQVGENDIKPDVCVGVHIPQCLYRLTIRVATGTTIAAPGLLTSSWVQEQGLLVARFEGTHAVIQDSLQGVEYCTKACLPFADDVIELSLELVSELNGSGYQAGCAVRTDKNTLRIAIAPSATASASLPVVKGRVNMQRCCSETTLTMLEGTAQLAVTANVLTAPAQGCVWESTASIIGGRFNTYTPINPKQTTKGVLKVRIESDPSVHGFASNVLFQGSIVDTNTDVGTITLKEQGCNCTPGPTTSPSQPDSPTTFPTLHVPPTLQPSMGPSSDEPSKEPTRTPSVQPSTTPTSSQPTVTPSSLAPTIPPSSAPTQSPSSSSPSEVPTLSVSLEPSFAPSFQPTQDPTLSPSVAPTTANPSKIPTKEPTFSTTVSPTHQPSTASPSVKPPSLPTNIPTNIPTNVPTFAPTFTPTLSPSSSSPSEVPTLSVSLEPSFAPSFQPTQDPTLSPSVAPTTANPSKIPTKEPTFSTTVSPTHQPSTGDPTKIPTEEPTNQPSMPPTNIPTRIPSTNPTLAPSGAPRKTPTNQPTSLNLMQLVVQVVQSPCGYVNTDNVSLSITGTVVVYAGDLLDASSDFLATQSALSLCTSTEISSTSQLSCEIQFSGTVTISITPSANTAFSTPSLFTLNCVGTEDTCTCNMPSGRCVQTTPSFVTLYVPESLGSGAMRACLHWTDTRATDLDLQVKFDTNSNTGPCVAGSQRNCGDVTYEKDRVGEQSESLMFTSISENKYMFFVWNYGSDSATQSTDATVSIFGQGIHVQFPIALDTWTDSSSGIIGSSIPSEYLLETSSLSQHTGSFDPLTAFVRVACVDATGYPSTPVRAAWSVMYMDHEPDSTDACPDTADCSYSISLSTAALISGNEVYAMHPTTQSLIGRELGTPARTQAESVDSSAVSGIGGGTCAWATGINWNPLPIYDGLANGVQVSTLDIRGTCPGPTTFQNAQTLCSEYTSSDTPPQALASVCSTVSHLGTASLTDSECAIDGQRVWTNETCLLASSLNGQLPWNGQLTRAGREPCGHATCKPSYVGERCWHDGSRPKSCVASWLDKGLIGVSGEQVNTMQLCDQCASDEDCRLFVFIGIWDVDVALYNFASELRSATQCNPLLTPSCGHVPANKRPGYCATGNGDISCGALESLYQTVEDGSCFEENITGWNSCACPNYDTQDVAPPIQYLEYFQQNNIRPGDTGVMLNHGALPEQCSSSDTVAHTRCCAVCVGDPVHLRIQSRTSSTSSSTLKVDVNFRIPPQSGKDWSLATKLTQGDFIAVVKLSDNWGSTMDLSPDLMFCNLLISQDVDIVSLDSSSAGEESTGQVKVNIPNEPGKYGTCLFRLTTVPPTCPSKPICQLQWSNVRYDVAACTFIHVDCPEGWTGIGCSQCTSQDLDDDGSPDCSDICSTDWTKTGSISSTINCACGINEDIFSNAEDLDGNGIAACNDCVPDDCIPEGSTLSKSYRGCVSTTSSGKTCQIWSEIYPHKHDLMNYHNNNGLCSAGPSAQYADAAPKYSHCVFPVTFNNIEYASGCIPDGTGDGWCIATWPEQESTVQPGMKVTDTETQYASPCMPCESVSKWPAALAGLGKHNNCRNPFNDPNGPWCFTNSPATRWEYCDVSTCPTSSPSTSPTTNTAGYPMLLVLDADRLEAYDSSYVYAGTLATTSSGGDTSSDSGALGTLFKPSSVAVVSRTLRYQGTYDFLHVGCRVTLSGYPALSGAPTGLSTSKTSKLVDMDANICSSFCAGYTYFSVLDGTTCTCGETLDGVEWASTEWWTQVSRGSSSTSSSSNGACFTNGLGEESVAGLACVFPFVDDDKTYTSCIGTGWGGQGVCKTATGSWGGCTCSIVETCNMLCDSFPCGGVTAKPGRALHSIYRTVRTQTTLSYVNEPLLGRIQMFDLAVRDENQGSFVEVMSRDTLDASAIGVWASPAGAASFKKGSTAIEDTIIAAIQGASVLLYDRHNVARYSIYLGSGVNTKDATIAFDPQSNPRRVIVALPQHHIVRIYSTVSSSSWSPSGACIAIGASSCNSLDESCNSNLCKPTSIAVGMVSEILGHLFVVDQGNQRVQVYNEQLQELRTIGSGILVRPQIVTVSSWRDNGGHTFVLDSGVKLIEFDRNGYFVGAKPVASSLDKAVSSSDFQVDAVGAVAVSHPCSLSSYCSSKGTCLVDGTCKCDERYFGDACEEYPTSFLVGFF